MANAAPRRRALPNDARWAAHANAGRGGTTCFTSCGSRTQAWRRTAAAAGPADRRATARPARIVRVRVSALRRHVCCNEACTDLCKACDLGAAPRPCTQVTSGQPHGARCTGSAKRPCAGWCVPRLRDRLQLSRRRPSRAGRRAARAGLHHAARGATAPAVARPPRPCSCWRPRLQRRPGRPALSAARPTISACTSAQPYCEGGTCSRPRSNGARCQAPPDAPAGTASTATVATTACQFLPGVRRRRPPRRLLAGPDRHPLWRPPALRGRGHDLRRPLRRPPLRRSAPSPAARPAAPAGSGSGTCDGAGSCELLAGLCL